MCPGVVADGSGEDGLLESGKLPEIAGSSFTGWVAPANWPTPLSGRRTRPSRAKWEFVRRRKQAESRAPLAHKHKRAKSWRARSRQHEAQRPGIELRDIGGR
jgi:hypothetical protein